MQVAMVWAASYGRRENIRYIDVNWRAILSMSFLREALVVIFMNGF